MKTVYLAMCCLLAITSAGLAQPTTTAAVRHECVVIHVLDGSAPYVSDAAECALRTAPASTFKIPHALIALATGVVSDPLAPIAWDGTKHPFPLWERDHSLDSAMKASAIWFYRRTAGLIGRERMLQQLKQLRYGDDAFEGELTSFWVNGDLVISPVQQLDFIRRLARYELPVDRRHIDSVKAAFLMPPGRITNASGAHEFPLTWPGVRAVRAKTGNARVGDERVSWIVGFVEAERGEAVFVSRVRSNSDLPGLAGANLAARALTSRAPGTRDN